MRLTDGEDLEKTILNAPIGVCIVDADNFVAEIVNDKFVEVAGRPYEVIFGRFYWDAFPETRAAYEKALSDVVKTGEAFYADEVELMLIRHGKPENLFYTFVFSPVKNNAGDVAKVAIWVLETTKQVTERQKREAEKNAFQQERLKSFFMQAPAGICILGGPDLVYEMVNPAYEKILPGRELLGRSIFEALPELVGTSLQEILLKVYRKGELYDISDTLIPIAEYEGGPLRGRYFSLSFQPRVNENGVIDGILNIVMEVTGIVKIQQDLQRAKEESDRQRRVYETITSGTPDLMYVWDLDYRFTYVNKALLTMWGKTWDMAIGKGLRENGYEEWHAKMHEREIDHVRSTKESVRGEVSFPHAVLGTRVYDYILIPVLNEQGEVEAIAGTTRDVTDRKQMEQALAQSTEELQAMNEEMAATNEEQVASNEELTVTNHELAMVNDELLSARKKIEEAEIALRLAIGAANFGTWFIHSVTREFITDARLKELFGYYPDEPLSIEQAIAQITEDYRGYVATKLENAIYNNGDYDVTYPVIGLHDEQLRWLRAIGNLKNDPSGAFSAFTGVVMDVTESYLAAKNIADAEENLRLATESGELATWHLSEKLGEIAASARFNELFGFDPDEEVPYTVAVNQILPEYRQMVMDAVNASFASGASFNVEYPISGYHDGKQRWIRAVGKYVADDKNGNYITGVMADITEQKTEEIRKNDFIGMVSHELKTPLTSLNAYLQMLQGKAKKEEDSFTLGALDQSLKQIKRMTTMINGFLNVSRLESGQIHIDKVRFDMAELVKETEAETIPMYASHEIIFEPVEETFVFADRDKIGQVINNLISNAVKYSKSGTKIQVACVTVNNRAEVSVSDQGIGVRQGDINRLFERYFRVKNDDHVSGFGIGLYLCAEIIKRHDGKIWAESEPGEGSTFHFNLPVA